MLPLHTFLRQHAAHEGIPLFHAGAFLWHVVPTIVVLGTDILQRVILKAVTNLLRYAGLAGQRLESPPQVPIRRIRNDTAVALSPDKAVERAVADGLGRVFGRRKVPAEFVWLDRLDELCGERWDRNGVGL